MPRSEFTDSWRRFWHRRRASSGSWRRRRVTSPHRAVRATSCWRFGVMVNLLKNYVKVINSRICIVAILVTNRLTYVNFCINWFTTLLWDRQSLSLNLIWIVLSKFSRAERSVGGHGRWTNCRKLSFFTFYAIYLANSVDESVFTASYGKKLCW